MALVRKGLKAKSCKKFGTVDFHVFRNIVENRSERAYFDRVVIRNGDAVVGGNGRRNADMTSGLSDRRIADFLKSLYKAGSRNVARNPHAAMTSSLTM